MNDIEKGLMDYYLPPDKRETYGIERIERGSMSEYGTIRSREERVVELEQRLAAVRADNEALRKERDDAQEQLTAAEVKLEALDISNTETRKERDAMAAALGEATRPSNWECDDDERHDVVCVWGNREQLEAKAQAILAAHDAEKDAEIAALRAELEVTKLRERSAEAIAGIAPYKETHDELS